MPQYKSKSVADTQMIAKEFAKRLSSGDVVLFSGDLGTGKTEFIKTICDYLGVVDDVCSPSYTIINQYESSIGTIFHIDLYRIKNSQEIIELGFLELFETPCSIFFIEWPENSFDLISHFNHLINIKFIFNDDNDDNDETELYERCLEIISL